MNPEDIHILYVDDDEDDFLLVKTLLRKNKRSSFQVDHAIDLEECLSKLPNGYQAFLVDYRLGRENGLEVLKAIHAHQQFAPVIMLTGMEDGEIDRQALTEGAADYLVKGEFDSQMLERTIRYALRDALLIETLETNNRRFRNIFERSADPIALVDNQGRIIKANPSFARLFGIMAGRQAPKTKFSSFLNSSDEQPMIDRAIAEALTFDDMEATMRTSDNRIIQVLINMVLHDPQTGTCQVMIKDLTSLREREEERQQMSKFASIGRIARIIAHEVKNPLTNITLSSDQLRVELPEAARKEVDDLIEVIDRNARRINQLVSELLQSTRFTELNMNKYSINQLLEDALEMAKDRIAFKQIKVEKDFSYDICDIDVDAEKVKIAFLNIIVNAVEAMPESTGVLRLKTEARDSKCVIQIHDNGPGIPNEYLERLFEPFFTSKDKGTGLGLTNAQNIILSHQGSIRVKSDPDYGTNFIISFNMT